MFMNIKQVKGIPYSIQAFELQQLTAVSSGSQSHYFPPDPRLPAAERQRPLTSTKLYCLATEAHVYEQLAQGRYMKWNNRTGHASQTLWYTVRT